MARSSASASRAATEVQNDTRFAGPRLGPPEYSDGGRIEDRVDSVHTEVAVVRIESLEDVHGRDDVREYIDSMDERDSTESLARIGRSIARSESIRGKQSNRCGGIACGG